MHYEKYICETCGAEFIRRGKSTQCRNCRALAYNKTTLTCQHCGVQFSGMPDTLYCRKCRNKWVVYAAPTIQCTTCGADMKSLYGETTCETCRKKARLLTSASEATCAHCGKKFTRQYYNEQLCASCKDTSNSITCKCVVCGSLFTPKRRTPCKTCSRKCQGLYVQANGFGMKYDDTALLQRIITHIKNTGIPISLDALGLELGGITHKVFTARGWTLQWLIEQAGIDTLIVPSNTSIFERSIYYMLVEIIGKEQIQLQKTFDSCRSATGRRLRFDFYLSAYNLIIEADGVQHYCEEAAKPQWDVSSTKRNDKIKNNWCLQNNINLLRIKYIRGKSKTQDIKCVLNALLPLLLETTTVKLFNCWDGSKLIPISSEACSLEQERSTTIPEGSTDEANASGNGSCPNK